MYPIKTARDQIELLSKAEKFGLAVVFIAIIAGCSSMDSVTTGENQVWINCVTAEAGNSWDCDKGKIVSRVNTGSATQQNSGSAFIDSSHASSIIPEPESTQQVGSIIEQTDSLKAIYSLQLAAFTSPARRETYLQSFPIQGIAADLRLQEDQVGDQIWWLVMYGNYMNYSEAVRAQSFLEETYGITNSWIKPLN